VLPATARDLQVETSRVDGERFRVAHESFADPESSSVCGHDDGRQPAERDIPMKDRHDGKRGDTDDLTVELGHEDMCTGIRVEHPETPLESFRRSGIAELRQEKRRRSGVTRTRRAELDPPRTD
jgi:hypothetical protein